MREIGFGARYSAWLVAASRYLPTFNFTDVLPVPNTSHAAPPRGERSL
jgi:hypothetical protein